MFRLATLLSALFIAACAAWFSISGISQLFIGAPIASKLMAISMEIGKLVVVSFVYRHWKEMGKTLKTYMIVGAIILSTITSTGIYGYLSSAYATSAVGFSQTQSQIASISSREDYIGSTITSNNNRITTLQSFRSQQESRLDALVGQRGFVTQQLIVRQADTDIRTLQTQNSQLAKERDSLESQKLALSSGAVRDNSKVGTFWYISQMLHVQLDTLVKWFTFAIVIVFDPLAIALVIAYNFLTKKELSTKTKEEVSEIKAPEIPAPALNATQPIPAMVLPAEKVDSRPYYMHPDYDWGTDTRWRTDPRALEYKEQMKHGVRIG